MNDYALDCMAGFRLHTPEDEGGRPKILNKDKQALAVQLYDERKQVMTPKIDVIAMTKNIIV